WRGIIENTNGRDLCRPRRRIRTRPRARRRPELIPARTRRHRSVRNKKPMTSPVKSISLTGIFDMPKRTDIHSVLIIGAGPIIIGQACEFDYSGTQACKALREEGYRVVLVNSNPATIMTDPEFADRTYIEPIT